MAHYSDAVKALAFVRSAVFGESDRSIARDERMPSRPTLRKWSERGEVAGTDWQSWRERFSDDLRPAEHPTADDLETDLERAEVLVNAIYQKILDSQAKFTPRDLKQAVELKREAQKNEARRYAETLMKRMMLAARDTLGERDYSLLIKRLKEMHDEGRFEDLD